MQQNIDTYFKEKLLHREFEMKPSYWEGAEAMLDEAEKKKRRGVLLWWFGGLLPVVALALFLLVGKGFNSKEAISQSSEIKQVGSPKTTSPEVENAPPTAEPDIPSPAISRQKTIAPPTKKGGKKVSGTDIDEDAKTAISTSFDEFSPSQKFLDEEKDVLVIERMATQPTDAFVAPGLLPNLPFAVEGNFDELPQAKNICYEPSPFHFGVAVAQLMQVAPKSGERLVTGFYGGVVFQYDFDKYWFASAGIGYMRRGGHFEASKKTEMRNYRFGLELMESQLRPTSLHYVSMPLGVGWKKGHHLFEGGILLDYLAGVRGEFGKIERLDPDVNTKEFVPYENAWITEEGFTRLNVSPMAGYRYRVNRELSFGLAAQFNLRPLTNREPGFGDYILQEDDRFNVRLNAVYLLK